MSTAAAPAPGDGEPAAPGDLVEVARVLGAWGIKGGIRVKPFAADPQALFSSKRWYLQPAEGLPGPRVAGTPALPALLRIVQAREQGDAIVATAHELPDRNAAEALKGARVFIPRSSFPTPADGEFYWVDLIGLSVLTREGQPLGQVRGLIETGPHCVLQIVAEDGAETLIPFVEAYVDAVDRGAGRITVDWRDDYR